MAADDIITGIVTNCDTGEAFDFEHMLYPNDATLCCVVFVVRVDTYYYDENNQWEIMATCRALDSVGFVSDLEIVWQPDAQQEKEKVLAVIGPGGYYSASGAFGGCRDGVIYMYDPICNPLPEDNVAIVSEVFKANSKG